MPDTEKLNKWLTLGANLGVVLGILILVFELRQNTAMMESQIRQSRTEAAQSEQQSVFNSDYMPEILVRVSRGDSISAEDAERYSAYFRGFNRNMDNQVWQYCAGFLGENIPRSVAGAVRTVIGGNDRALELWERTKSSYTDEYIAFVDLALLGGVPGCP